LQEARVLKAGGAVTLGSPENGIVRATVRSADVTHRVRLGTDEFHCTCVWHARTGGDTGPCKHVLAAMLAMEWQEP
jgi:hypothetical protein